MPLQGLQEHVCASHDLFVYDFSERSQEPSRPDAPTIRVACPTDLFDSSGTLQSLEANKYAQDFNRVRVAMSAEEASQWQSAQSELMDCLFMYIEDLLGRQARHYCSWGA